MVRTSSARVCLNCGLPEGLHVLLSSVGVSRCGTLKLCPTSFWATKPEEEDDETT